MDIACWGSCNCKSEAPAWSILDSVPFAIAVIDGSGYLCTRNHNWCALNEPEDPAFPGIKPGQNYLDAIDFPELANRIKAASQQPDYQSYFEYHYLTEQRIDHWIKMTVSAVSDYPGQVTLVREDISESKRGEKNLLQYSEIVSATQEMIFYVDKHYVYKVVNETYLKYHQMKREQVIGMTMSQMLGKEYFETQLKTKIDLCMSGEIVEIESQFTFSGTGLIHIGISYFPHWIESGEIAGMVCVIRDISELIKSRQELLERESRMQTVLGSLAEGVVVHDRDGKIIECNRSAELISGLSRKRLLTRDSIIQGRQAILDNGSSVDPQDYPYSIARRTGKPQFERVLGIRDKENSFKWILVNAIPTFDDDESTPNTVVTSFVDITESRKHREEQLQMERELGHGRKMQALGKLTGGIAHDFNNLLAIILGFSGLARSESANLEKLRHYNAKIEEAGTKAKQLVSQLLTYSKDKLDVQEPVQLQPLITRDIEMLRSALPSSIEIHSDLINNLPRVVISPTHLNQLIMNLSINARNAMPTGGKLEFKLQATEVHSVVCSACCQQISGNYIELSVSDTGAGMAEELVEQIFDPYFTTQVTGEGTGLGLAVVHGILRRYGGHIIVESTLGQGSRFRLFLRPDESFQSARTQPDGMLDNKIKGLGESILIVDDEPGIATFLQDLLSAAGYSVTTETSSERAYQNFKRNPDEYDLVLTDQTMPGLSGLELAKNLRSLRPDLPVILCSGYMDQISLGELEDLSISFLEKPFDSAKMLIQIADVVRLETA